MTEQTKKDMRGYLHPNTNKSKPTQPDHTGTGLINGQEYRLAAWENKTSDGKPYLSIIFSLPLTPEQQNQFKSKNNDNNGNNVNNSNVVQNENGNNQLNNNSNSTNMDGNFIDEDIGEILKFTEDENPFD